MAKKARFAAVALAALSGWASGCEMRDLRVCEIHARLVAFAGDPVLARYERVDEGQMKSKAETEWVPGGPYVIRLADPESLSRRDLTFLIAHEFAHAYKKHSRREIESVAPKADWALSDQELFAKYGDPEGAPASLAHDQEFEADEFAARFMASLGLDPVAALRSVAPRHFESATHPSTNARISRIKAALAQIQGEDQAKAR